MIDREHGLSAGRQAKALGIGRGSAYPLPRPTSGAGLALMRRLDEVHLESPFAGSRMLRGLLTSEGYEVGRLHVATLMRRIGIEALYRRPNTSKPAPGHKIHPCLLRNLTITRPNQVWAMDITYAPMARGFAHLAAAADWLSRKGPAWKLPITLSADFGLEALEEALARHGRPEIFKTGPGAQSTSADFIKVLKQAEVAISRDGKGAWRDHVFVERLWRTARCEEVYLRAHAGVSGARASIGRHLGFHNPARPHPSLGGQTSDQSCYDQPTPVPAAA
jgi:putative transposase